MKEYKFKNGASIICYAKGFRYKLFAVFFQDELIGEDITSWQDARALALSF